MNVELGGGTLGLEDFVDDFYELDGFADTGYFETLERHGIDTSEGIDSCDIDHGDIDLIRACVSVNIFFTIFTNVFSPIAPTRMRRIRQRGCAAFGV